MTIANDMIQGIQEQIEASINEQDDAKAEEISQAVTNTLPFAVLQLLGVIHNNTRAGEDGAIQTTLNQQDFEYVSATLQRVLNLLGWNPVVTGQEEDGSTIIGLVPLGFGGDEALPSDAQEHQGDGQAPGNSYE